MVSPHLWVGTDSPCALPLQPETTGLSGGSLCRSAGMGRPGARRPQDARSPAKAFQALPRGDRASVGAPGAPLAIPDRRTGGATAVRGEGAEDTPPKREWLSPWRHDPDCNGPLESLLDCRATTMAEQRFSRTGSRHPAARPACRGRCSGMIRPPQRHTSPFLFLSICSLY